MGKKRNATNKKSAKSAISSRLAEQLAKVQPVTPEASMEQAKVATTPAPLAKDAWRREQTAPGGSARAPLHPDEVASLDDDAMLALWEANDAMPSQALHRTSAKTSAMTAAKVRAKAPPKRQKASSATAQSSRQKAEMTSKASNTQASSASKASRAGASSASQNTSSSRKEKAEQRVQDDAATIVLLGLQQTLEGLQQALAASQESLATMSLALEKERERSQRFLAERDQARAAQYAAQGAHAPIESELSRRGIPEALQGQVLGALATSHPAELLPLVSVSPAGFRSLVEKQIALCCGHDECEQELRQSTTRQLVQVADMHECENCQGSDNRRAFQRMIRMCREKRRYRMIVVGGSPDAHAELDRLTPDGLIQRIVTGKERRTRQQATEDLRHADILVVWGPTILPHKISELYTRQKEDYPDKIALVLKRGVASFAREVCVFLERLD